MSVDEELERIVEIAFAQTERLLDASEVTWEVARGGVEKIMIDLAVRYPRDADWIRSRLADWVRAHAN